ncbi:uncharacterized protein SCHCODRAFT_02512082 [Schizophyllum commune H4-8]|nr:uncharacterized protein SCHCODRAFT_02512082 [Schizophyllum commune H4-8]KAI5888872.1 hypothetical protein SCHCODRAFT_02512082 [Schizophyllum commune H4-8]
MRRPDNDGTRSDLVRSQTEVDRLQERCKALEKSLRDTREALRSRDMEIEALKRERGRALSRSKRGSASSMRTATSSTHHAHHKSRGAADKDDVDDAELDARHRSMEIYMTRTDSWSGAQILQSVQDLNSEILQFAASAAELCPFGKSIGITSLTKSSAAALQDTTARLGSNMARILATKDHSQDPLLVQLAVQACVVTCIIRALSSFCIGFPQKGDTILSQLYSHIYVAEPQPTSSRWRSYAHRHIHSLYPTLTEYSVNEMTETIIRWTCDILTVAGTSDPHVSSREGLRSRFGDHIRRIARCVSRLEHVMREEIMSTNFDIVSVGYGDVFNGRIMADVFGDVSVSRGHVLATTELGLKCTTRRDGTGSDNGTIEQRLLLPPKVVSESVLDVLDSK